MMQKLVDYIKKFKKTRILCIGDIMFDEFVYGVVNRISPEAPVPLLKVESQIQMLGGSGNVVNNLKSLGAEVDFLGIVGNDGVGKVVEACLGDSAHLLKKKGYMTTIKTRYIAGTHHVLRVDNEVPLLWDDELIEHFCKKVEALVPKADVILMSDYKKGVLTYDICQFVIKIAHKHKKRVLVDPKGNDYMKYNGAYLIKPNLKEFFEAVNQEMLIGKPNYKTIQETALKLIQRLNVENMIITLSEYGMMLVHEGMNSYVHIPTNAKEVFDVSGAGDTCMATLGLALSVGASLEEAMILANLAAGIVVGKLGTACVRGEELIKVVENQK